MSAAKKNTKSFELDLSTKVDLIATRGDEVFKVTTSYREALEKIKKKKKGFIYIIYQVGFSQFKNTNNELTSTR